MGLVLAGEGISTLGPPVLHMALPLSYGLQLHPRFSSPRSDVFQLAVTVSTWLNTGAHRIGCESCGTACVNLRRLPSIAATGEFSSNTHSILFNRRWQTVRLAFIEMHKYQGTQGALY